MDALAASMNGASVIKGEIGKLNEYKDKINSDKNIFAVHITEKDSQPYISIISKDFMTTVSYDYIAEVLSNTYTANALREHGIDDKTIALARRS
jgi:hypothetical protein